jgi:hypothetical protein
VEEPLKEYCSETSVARLRDEGLLERGKLVRTNSIPGSAITSEWQSVSRSFELVKFSNHISRDLLGTARVRRYYQPLIVSSVKGSRVWTVC